MKHLVIGILAHVDAGKTTLSEALLYTAGRIRKLGRVDKRDTFLDTHALERERGITIFSKPTTFSVGSCSFTLLDTPGHVDFSAETERALSVLDLCILVISGTDGIQAHTETLWRLLRQYRIPTFLFITKRDLPGPEKEKLWEELSLRLGSGCVDFSDGEGLEERIALSGEEALEVFSSGGRLSDAFLSYLIAKRALFPCYFGSGLKLSGVAELLDGLCRLAPAPSLSDDFGARVYKIAHDKNGTRVTFLKVTGGSLTVRQTLTFPGSGDGETVEEKITGLRLYAGERFEAVESVPAGRICGVTGLSSTYAGQGLGSQRDCGSPFLEPVLSYRVALPPDCDVRTLLPRLRELEEEDPMLRIVFREETGEITAQVMGQVQREILIRLIEERFGVCVSLENEKILYKETIDAPGVGIGHYEPLRHYAEVHLRLTPLPRGTGMRFDTELDEDVLEGVWQRSILYHLSEKRHPGVLTGAPLTDVRVTLIAGRAHIKHTDSLDFREAAFRALRQGLMRLRESGNCVLLEPYVSYRLEVPGDCLGRAMTDLAARGGTFAQEESPDPESAVITGRAPVSALSDYARDVTAYTRGRGRFFARPDGYDLCPRPEAPIEEAAYRPESDSAHSPDSIFCAHGAGFLVPWRDVPEYCHLSEESESGSSDSTASAPRLRAQNLNLDDKELEALMDREFGPIRRRQYKEPTVYAAKDGLSAMPPSSPRRTLYLIDGYNVIFAWDELSQIAQTDLDDARRRLIARLSSVRAYTEDEMVLVFDAYHVADAEERKSEVNGLYVVFTKEGELADTYLERFLHNVGKDDRVRAVTSDALIQLQAVRSGVLRVSAREFRDEILEKEEEIRKKIQKEKPAAK